MIPAPHIPTHQHQHKKQTLKQVTVVISSRREEFDVDAKGQRIVAPTKAAGKGAGGAAVRPPVIFDNESICVFEVNQPFGVVCDW